MGGLIVSAISIVFRFFGLNKLFGYLLAFFSSAGPIIAYTCRNGGYNYLLKNY